MPDKKIKILLVDDEVELLEMYAELFEAEGFEIRSSTSANEALTIFKNNLDIKMIISDANMTGMSGLEFLKCLQELHSSIPLFYLSTGDMDQTDENIKLLGGNGLIMKPFDFDEIVVKIKRDLKL